MHGRASNCASILEDQNYEVNGNEAYNINKNEEVEKILGLQWLNVWDEFLFQINTNKINPEILNGQRVPTNREILHVIMSVFDHLGFLSPMTIKARILM